MGVGAKQDVEQLNPRVRGAGLFLHVLPVPQTTLSDDHTHILHLYREVNGQCGSSCHLVVMFVKTPSGKPTLAYLPHWLCSCQGDDDDDRSLLSSYPV